MISVKEALDIVLENASLAGVVEVPLRDAVGRTLAEEIVADRDFPPFDRVTMDGIAIAYQSYEDGQRSFEIESIQAAGSPQQSLRKASHCIEVMTGAMMPLGADTVIRYEDLKQIQNSYSILTAVKPNKNIHYKGGDLLIGATLISKGSRIKAIDINALATVGKSKVAVVALPKVAVISSGDELVPISEKPADYQIRRSNIHMLAARLSEYQIKADCFHLADHKEAIKERISELEKEYDVLLLSGGVSKGKYDFIPEVLNELGFEKQFHKVAQRPGKPFWFGTKDQTTVFAFPGNPVSTLLCFHRYFIPWLNKTQGHNTPSIKVSLTKDHVFKPDLTQFALARISQEQSGLVNAEINNGNGSGDIVGPLSNHGFICLPQGRDLYKSGEKFDFIPFYPIFK